MLTWSIPWEVSDPYPQAMRPGARLEMGNVNSRSQRYLCFWISLTFCSCYLLCTHCSLIFLKRKKSRGKRKSGFYRARAARFLFHRLVLLSGSVFHAELTRNAVKCVGPEELKSTKSLILELLVKQSVIVWEPNVSHLYSRRRLSVYLSRTALSL